MKKFILNLMLVLIATTVCYSQDIITKKSGEDIPAKVIEVGHTEIKFKRMDNLDGPIFTLLKSDILMIRYENGTKDIMIESVDKGLDLPEFSVNDYYRQGQMDAKKYYSRYKPAATGTLLTGIFLTPIGGLVPAVLTSTTEPEDSNLGYPDIELMKNAEYYKGYTENAKKIKSKKVWTNWGIALGVNVVAYWVIVNSAGY